MIRAFLTLMLVFMTLHARAAPLDTVLAALAAEEAAPIERVRLFIELGDVADVYYIDRVRPGRFRMVKNPRQGGPEFVVVDDLQWMRTAAGWEKSPAPTSAGVVPSMAGLFREGLSDAVEQADPDGGRSIEGVLAWSNGTPCKGKVLLRIDAAGLPSLLRFDGMCGDRPSRFRQAFSYTGPVVIMPPE